MDAIAKSIISRAVELDNKKRYTEAVTCYAEGLAVLLDAIKELKDEKTAEVYRTKAAHILKRAETIKRLVEEEKELGKYHEQIQIEDNDTGYSYTTVFGRFMDEKVKRIEVEDAFVRVEHQLHNFTIFCELAVSKCKNLKEIHLLTGEAQNVSRQFEALDSLKNSLAEHNITLEYKTSSTLHDREIRLDSGWIIKIGRGLDYLKGVNKFTIGFHDMDQRPCHKTTIDIFHKKALNG